MDKDEAALAAVEAVEAYAKKREADAGYRLETPRLAAFAVRKFSEGVHAAHIAIYDDVRAADPIFKATEAAVTRIDPDWRKTDRERRQTRPADLHIEPSL